MPSGTAFFPNLTPYFKLDGSRTITGPSTLALDAGGAASDALTIRGASGQTGHLLVLEDSDGTNRFTFRPAGRSLTATDLPPVVGAQTYGDYRQITLTRNPASSTPNDYFSSNGLLIGMTQPSDSTIRNAYGHYTEVTLNGRFNLGFGQSHYVQSNSASTAIDLSASILYAYHDGAGQLAAFEGQQIYTGATGPVISHVGQIVSAENSGATGTFTGQSVTASHSTGAISTSLIGASIAAILSSGSVPTLIGLDVAVTGTGSSTTYALRTTGGSILATGPTLTGSTATSLLSLAQTWNTSGTPTAIHLNVTNTASNVASKLLDLQVGGTSQVKIQRNGYMAMGLGSTAPAAMIDMVSANAQFIQMGSSTADATIQRGYFQIRHYTAAQPGLSVFHANVQSGASQILIGGGVGALNAATSLVFYTAANNVTTTGTARLTIDSSGDITLGDGTDFILNTSTGTKIGTATTQKLGFYNATPVVRPVLATGAGRTVDDVITVLQTLGLVGQT